MKSQIVFSLIIIIAIQLVSSASYQVADEAADVYKPTLPCPGCVYHYKPICAKSTVTGEHKSFDNSCIMKAADCGKTEHRKLFTIIIFIG